MQRLPRADYPLAWALYGRHGAFFPLIGAVLCGEQDGQVFADSAANPRQFYVEHAFGFAQVFGLPVAAFEAALQRYWLVDKTFASAKARLYTPTCPAFLTVGDWEGVRSWRQHFDLDFAYAGTAPELAEGTTVRAVEPTDLGLIQSAFGVVDRFWRTPDDFARHALAVVGLVRGEPAALCYAAAVSGGRAEIDVLTLPAFRHLGLARAVVDAFSHRCLEHQLRPLWDCFTNNTASMALCRAAGFVPLGEPYPFFTFNR